MADDAERGSPGAGDLQEQRAFPRKDQQQLRLARRGRLHGKDGWRSAPSCIKLSLMEEVHQHARSVTSLKGGTVAVHARITGEARLHGHNWLRWLRGSAQASALQKEQERCAPQAIF